MSRNKEIANTIWAQMQAIDKNLCMCMGVSKLQIVRDGLQFSVNGLSFKGLVQITLNGADLYDVKFIKPVKKLNKVAQELGVKMYDTTYDTVSEENNVFAEDLMYLLENMVENRNK